MEERLPTHIEVAGLIRAVENAGGFGTVIAKGERDAGTMLILCCEKGTKLCAYERMPQLDGSRAWSLSREQDIKNPMEFHDFCERRRRQDSDLWILELDHPDAVQFLTPLARKG